ncbi:5240_t:CDS:2 [Entrophospora sp. SA101]|nr:5240_t:CDS:2 [Entrophospora sp. SA101]
MELPDHVRHHVNVAVVAMILESRTGHSNRSSMYGSSVNKMWTMSDKLHEIIFSCLVSEESVLRFVNWFFDGIRKTFDDKTLFLNNNVNNVNNGDGNVKNINNDGNNDNTNKINNINNVIKFPTTCFQCNNNYLMENWCYQCESFLFQSNFHKWTSDNKEIDSFIRETQLEVPNYYKFLRYFGNYEEEFQIIKEINTTPKNVLSESKWISNNNNRFNGTLKQWVYNTQLEIILDYLKFNNKELSEKLNNDKLDGELWNDLLQDFIVRMKKIYEMRKTLKLRFADHDDDTKLGNDGDDGGSGNVYGNGQVQGIQIKRKETNRFFKKLFKLPLKKKKKLINNQVRRDSSTIAIKYITNVPKSTSPFNDDANNDEDKNKLVMLKQILNSENISKDFITQVMERCWNANINNRSNIDELFEIASRLRDLPIPKNSLPIEKSRTNSVDVTNDAINKNQDNQLQQHQKKDTDDDNGTNIETIMFVYQVIYQWDTYTDCVAVCRVKDQESVQNECCRQQHGR